MHIYQDRPASKFKTGTIFAIYSLLLSKTFQKLCLHGNERPNHKIYACKKFIRADKALNPSVFNSTKKGGGHEQAQPEVKA